jgi:C1A family cysteine protease
MCDIYEKVLIEETGELMGTGWIPPMPDLRDYTEEHESIAPMLEKAGIKPGEMPGSVPRKVDLRQWCSPVESQGGLNSCSAHAAAGIIEYYEKRTHKKHIDASRLFIYKNTRNLMRVSGDTGAHLRYTMGALVLTGVAPEKYWPYVISKFDEEPPSFVYAVADNYETLRYFCHDPLHSNIPKSTLLQRLKNYIAHGIPFMFGFHGFKSFGHANVAGGIPLPCPGERSTWAHAIVAVGFDDDKIIKNTDCPSIQSRGAFLIRNSYGKHWGDNGYGWIPYEYFLRGYAKDCWSLMKMEWVDTGAFGLD